AVRRRGAWGRSVDDGEPRAMCATAERRSLAPRAVIVDLCHHRAMRVFHARAEFRRRGPTAPWVLAGVVIDHRLWPARSGVEPIRSRLPEAGLVGWRGVDPPAGGRAEEAPAGVAPRGGRGPRPAAARAA